MSLLTDNITDIRHYGNAFTDHDPNAELANLRISIGFEDIALYQKKNQCNSRLDADIKSEVFRGVFIDNPLIAANMSTVSDASFCIHMAKAGGMGVLHRAAPVEFLVEQVKKMAKELEIISVSIGVGKNALSLANALINAGATALFIDVAHGYNDNSINLCKALKNKYPGIKLIIGNTINPDMMYDVTDFVDAVKVGIAQGLACETKNTAGCTEKQFSAIYRFRYISRELGLPIIGDGGIREPADYTKAIAAGASSVMAGSIFARCPESAAELMEIKGSRKKVYAGMASRYVQQRWRGGLKPGTCPEGGVRFLDPGESVYKLMERYGGALRSGITYSGGVDIKSFQRNAEFIRV